MKNEFNECQLLFGTFQHKSHSLTCVDIKKPTFSTILECLETLGHFGSVWVIWALCGPLRACLREIRGASCPRGPGRLEPACNFEQFRAFRATRLSFEQPAGISSTSRNFEQTACISSKVNHGLIRTNPWTFEQPA